MASDGRRGFTLIELLIVMVILSLLMALVLPAIINALKVSREAVAVKQVSQLYTACKMYEVDRGVYPPGDGTGSRELASALGTAGPRGIVYFETTLPEVLWNGHFSNPVWPPDGSSPSNIIYYRNNTTGIPPGPGGRAQPPVYHPASVDLWCAGANLDPSDPSTAWSVNIW